ncbi:TIGR00645 family protein [Brucella anthropi]|uniref:TIGR00645 family protein n=1 Tax=Brucella anthropi TaxID=529 RepID=UPI003986A071
MKRIELLIENIILASRWLLVVFYLGLAIALAIYAVSFMGKLFDFATKVTALNDTDTILKVLGLIDAALIASLVVMVIISGYENFVSRFDQAGDEVHWLGTIDAGSLKIKVASTIVAISSIHLLQIFLNATTYTSNQLMWFTIIHLAFVFSALFLAYIDRLTAKGKSGAKAKGKVEPNI